MDVENIMSDFCQSRGGYTLNEFFVASSVFLLIVGLAVPGFVRRRNESAAIEFLQTIAASQREFAESCGSGGYARTFVALDSASTRRNGYNFTLSKAGDSTTGSVDCHGMPTHAAYVVTAEPTVFGISGVRSFAINRDRVIWQVNEGTAPTEPFTAPAVRVQQ